MLATATARADDVDAGIEAPDAGPLPSDGSGMEELRPAEPIAFKAILEKAEVPLAQPFSLTLEIRHSPKESYSLPNHLELGEFGIRKHDVETHGDDPKTTVLRLSMQAFAVGDRTLRPFHLSVDTAEGPKQFEVPAQKVKVTGIIDDSQGPPEMKEDSRPLMSLYRWVLWPVWVLLAVALGIAGALWYRHRQQQPVKGPPPKPRPPPFEEALDRLQALEQENLVGTGHKQEFYFRLSEIVRDFAGRRYGFDALESTSDELLFLLRQRPTPGLDYDSLERFLRDSDMVKFAKVEPTDGESKTIFEGARALIIRARPPNPDRPDGRPQ